VYRIESYRYWGEQLGRHDFTYGQLGENLTVEGLADDEVCIGDRYLIGDVVFEVTQPRVTPTSAVPNRRPRWSSTCDERAGRLAGTSAASGAHDSCRPTTLERRRWLHLWLHFG
jgi:MOSC domain